MQSEYRYLQSASFICSKIHPHEVLYISDIVKTQKFFRVLKHLNILNLEYFENCRVHLLKFLSQYICYTCNNTGIKYIYTYLFFTHICLFVVYIHY